MARIPKTVEELIAATGPQSLPAGENYLLHDLLYRAMALANSSDSIVETSEWLGWWQDVEEAFKKAREAE